MPERLIEKYKYPQLTDAIKDQDDEFRFTSAVALSRIDARSAKAAMPLLEKAGIAQDLDDGCVALEKPDAAAAFVKMCGKLRYWDRAPKVKQV